MRPQLLAAALALVSCGARGGAAPAPDGAAGGEAGAAAERGFPTVFADLLSQDMAVAGFAGAVNTMLLDRSDVRAGSASLRLSVPATGYTGAAIRSAAPHDLAAYTALTFWAKASAARTLDVVGL